MGKSKLARCPNCKGIIVTWNWFGPLEQTGPMNLEWKEWTHECWVCDNTFTTRHEVTNGVPYEALKILWDIHEAGLPVIYTKAMKLLFDPK